MNYWRYKGNRYAPGNSSNAFPQVQNNVPVLEKKTVGIEIDGIPVRKLFVTNIDKSARNEDLYNNFKQYGTIINVFISRKNANLTKPTTFGFITFGEPADAYCALQSSAMTSFKGKRLYLVPADSWHQPVVNSDGSVDYKTTYFHKDSNLDTSKEELEECNGLENSGAINELLINSCSYQESDDCPVSKLNDDCLWLIFSKLPMDSQITASKVCKRWEVIISNMLKATTSFDFSKCGFHNGESDYINKLLSVLEFIGPNLKELIVNGKDLSFNLSKSYISYVARYCPNLEVLNVSNVEIAPRSLMFLSRKCNKLKSITFSVCQGLTDQELAYIFSQRNSKLETVSLSDVIQLSGACFLSLKSPLKTLILEKCNINSRFLATGLNLVKDTLKHLSFQQCVSPYDLKYMGSLIPQLTSLTLANTVDHSYINLDLIGHFRLLEALDLTRNDSVTDKIIQTIAENCKLIKDLSICGPIRNHGLTGASISELRKLQNLEVLNIGYLEQVNDKSLQAFCESPPTRLKKLLCSNSLNVEDKGIASILSTCTELELLDVTRCLLINNDTIKNALKAVRQRKNNTPLTVQVFGTNVVFSSSETFTHPLLNVNFDITYDYIDELMFHCTGDGFCDRLDCHCCYNDDDDDVYGDSDYSYDSGDEDFEDLFFDFENFIIEDGLCIGGDVEYALQ